MTEMTPDIDAIKTRMKAAWMAGDFGQIAKYNEQRGEDFIARLGIPSGARVLDVACGTGNATFPAARAGAIVTGVDIAPNLLEQARARAQAEGLKIQFDEGDAELLPYPDGSFDIVVTMFGAMFAPRPELAAAELVRVCRPGGRIAMANWTPQGFSGKQFKVVAKYVPPPPGVPPPVLWGDEATVRQRLSKNISDLRLSRQYVTLEFPFSVPETVEFFRQYFGPTQRAFEKLDSDGQKALRQDLENLWMEHNRATDGTASVESEYLEVIAVRG